MTSITALKGIGEKTASYYSKIGIDTVEDAVFYFPRDYITYEEVSDESKLSTGVMTAFYATVTARPMMRRMRRGYITTVKLSCGHTLITATWYNMPYLSKSLKPQTAYIFRGKLSCEGDHFHVEQPRIYTQEQYDLLLGHINPVYPLTKGLTNNNITTTVKKSFDLLGDTVRTELYDLHFPKDEETLIRARNVLVYDELLVFMLRLRMLRDGDKAVNDFNIIEAAECERVIEKLPYRLTGAQMRVWHEIREDLCSHVSMRRLVQGDVGCGKTVIAALAAIMVSINRYQCAIMVPTEILAGQHYDSINKMIKDAGLSVNVVLLTGSMTEASKKNVRKLIKDGTASIIIGTHALFYDKVEYNDLALVITDEQHRFGVNQRIRLSTKNPGMSAHVLVMSATPIPRTLAMILYGDLSISVIDEVPAHKLPIKNAVVGEPYRKKAYEFMDKEIKAGHQVYVICPLIEESEGIDAKNVTDTAEEMRRIFDDSVTIGVLHGQMKGGDKNRVMEDFAKGYTNILVSTTVVEVGVNVPNATVMMIENAERFGLAALHQLRGRIGRGPDRSYCIFMCGNDRPESMERLQILARSNNGFEIAEEDMRIRGPGDMFGIRQSGEMHFRLADIYTDKGILEKASRDADSILKDDPQLSKKEHEHLLCALRNTYDEDPAAGI